MNSLTLSCLAFLQLIFVESTLIFQTNSEFGMGDNWEDSYLTYNTTGGDDSSSSSSRSFRSVDDNSSTKKRTLPIMSRTNFYIMLKDKLERSGYPAESCLLRLICETNSSTLGQVNGLLGSIVHILFTPSSSNDENLDKDYYQAEWDGLRHGDCSSYASQCEENVLDLISRPLHDVLREALDRRNGRP
ncbi:GM19477 [Drosophila sechellia]|uniref:GM19477 n=1 Tax=Drosophila sechellia TaxID=7238 RepID=B4HRB6_DROSE|nr:GM19477 [Drosophila sechellia]